MSKLRQRYTRTHVRLIASVVALTAVACSGDKQQKVAAAVHGPIAMLMTQHGSAACEKSGRTYPTIFWHPPYQTCIASTSDSTETAEIDSDSVVVEVYNTWALTPANHAAAFSQAVGELETRFGSPHRCSDTAMEWRQGDSLHMVIQVKPVSAVGTEFDEGPWRMTRIARLGPLDPANWGC